MGGEERMPPLPPRKAVGGQDEGRGSGNLMDEDRDQMKGWEPLKPGQ